MHDQIINKKKHVRITFYMKESKYVIKKGIILKP